jgi:hypothetical protein
MGGKAQMALWRFKNFEELENRPDSTGGARHVAMQESMDVTTEHMRTSQRMTSDTPKKHGMWASQYYIVNSIYSS